MTDILIETGVPLPAPNGRTLAYGSSRNVPFEQLEVGQSFVVPVARFAPTVVAAWACRIGARRGRRFATRWDQETLGTRVWRVA